MNIYTENGYLDIAAIRSANMPLTLIIGARGVGKTYGTLKEQEESGRPYILMRRTQKELDACMTPKLDPYKKLNSDMGWNIHMTKDGDIANIGHAEQNSRGRWVVTDPHAVGVALSTFANIRGFDGQEYQDLIYDEFIPESRARPIKDEGDAFLNAYETINRNRELEGRPPLRAILLANSNRLDNPIFLTLGLVSKVSKMARDGQEVSIMPNRGIMVVNILHSPISELKRNTALYKFTGDSSFSGMALNNAFIGEDCAAVNKHMPLIEYRPMAAIGEICIYAHKTNGSYYITTHKTGSPPTFGLSDAERLRFKQRFGWLRMSYLQENIIFEERICEILLTNYLK